MLLVVKVFGKWYLEYGNAWVWAFLPWVERSYERCASIADVDAQWQLDAAWAAGEVLLPALCPKV